MPSCESTDTDPYGLTADQLLSCGDEVFPLAAIEPLSDGGSSYIYYIDGERVEQVIPPAGLTYASATEEQREDYGLNKKIQGQYFVSPPPFLIRFPKYRFSIFEQRLVRLDEFKYFEY